MNKQNSFFEKKASILTIIFVIFLFFIVPSVLTLFIKIVPGGVQPSLGNTKKIYGKLILSQSFVSPEGNLTGIGVSIKNPNFANKKVTFFNLYQNVEVIRKVDLNGQNIADGKFVKIIFDPIPDSKNRRFTWSVYSPDSTFDDALEIFLTDQKPSWSLDLKINNETFEQGFSYVTLHKVTRPTQILEEVITGWVNKIIADKFFFVGWISLVLILFIVIVAKFPFLR